MISVEEARALVRRHAAPLQETESVPLVAALGRVLAGEVVADRDDPPFDRSMMDGFAVRSQDIAALPQALDVVGEVSAGDERLPEIRPHQAVRINTGAPVPPGADAVVPVEQTRGEVEILEGVAAGHCILDRGALAKSGTVVATGEITPEALAVCASAGADPVTVIRRVRCAVLSTGTELSGNPGAHEIRNSNGPMLAALLSGCQVEDLGSVRDDPDDLRARLERGLSADVLVTTGGVSKGQKDYVPGLLADLGVTQVFHRIALQPGKPVLFGTHPGGVVFALPGNPVSALVCADLFLLPYVAALGAGSFEGSLSRVPARTASGIQASPKRTRVFPCRLSGDEVDPLPWRGSADLYSAQKGNAYVVIEQGLDAAPGDEVTCLVPARHAVSVRA
jgi:molybdopterin molybdotransferase